jgi:hypothetical protein
VWIRASGELEFQMVDRTPLKLRLRSGLQQWIARESCTLAPGVPGEEYTGLPGNLCPRSVAPAGRFAVRTAEVRAERLVEPLY